MKLAATIFASALLAPGLALGAASLAPHDQERAKQHQHPHEETLQDHQVQHSHGQDERTDRDSDEQALLSSTPARDASLKELIGSDVKSRTNNEDIGMLDDILVDQNGQPVAALISVGVLLGIGDKTIAVDWGSVQVVQKGPAHTQDDERVLPNEYILIVDVSHDALQNSPGFHRDDR